MAAGDALRGQTLGGYLLGEPLGAGGMGAVYRGESLRGGPARAVKVLLEALDPELQARFRHEAEALSRLRHPGVVQVVDWGTDQGRPFLVMELVEGGTLHAKLRQGPLPQDQAAALVAELARTLAVAHAQGVVHRDVKPSNILLRPDGRPVLTDFGLARMVGRQTRLTQTGELLGTPAYMAPEQATGEQHRIGPATDVYALGVLLYECLTGSLPFEASSAMALLHDVVETRPPSPAELRPELDPDLVRICLRCLEKDPYQRWSSAAELAEALSADASSAPGGRALRVAAAVIALGLAVALGVVVGRGSAPDEPAEATPAAPQDPPTTAPPQEPPAARPSPDLETVAPSLPAWVEALEPASRPPHPLPADLIYTENDFEVQSPRDGGVLRWIPPGAARFPGLEPQTVRVDGCFLGVFEVSWRQLRTFLEREGWATEASAYQGTAQRLDRPALNVRWGLAAAYCRWVGGRLPTEAEWRRAAFGDDGRPYPWGHEPPTASVARLGVPDRGTLRAHAVPALPSALGCLGMGGNLAEWTQDWLAPLAVDLPPNPRGPGLGELGPAPPRRVVMGGSYRSTGEQAHWSARRGEPPNGPRQQLWGSQDLTDVGFRVCVPAGFVPRAPGPWTVEAYRFPPPRPTEGQVPPPPGEPDALLAASPRFAPFLVEHLRFTWGDRGPGVEDGGRTRCPGLPVDGFGLRATARVALPAGRWLIHTVSDDGIRLDLDGERVIDLWTHHGDTAQEYGFELREPREVELRVDYFENFGSATLHVDVFPD